MVFEEPASIELHYLRHYAYTNTRRIYVHASENEGQSGVGRHSWKVAQWNKKKVSGWLSLSVRACLYYESVRIREREKRQTRLSLIA